MLSRHCLLTTLAPAVLLAGVILIFVPVIGSFMEPRILGGRAGTFIGTIIDGNTQLARAAGTKPARHAD